MMTKLVFPKSEDETEGVEIGGLIYLETVKREEEDSDDIPAALTGYVCPGLFSDPAAEGWMHFGGGPKKGAACFVIPAKKYKAWSAFLPNSVVSRDTEEGEDGKYYVWFLMDGHPTGCSIRNEDEEVMLFWDGFALLVPTRVHKWLPNPPETLATLTCAEAFRILGLPEPVAIPEILRPYMESDAEGKGVRLIPAHEGMPCIGMLLIPAVQYDTVKARFSDALKRAPVCRPETPANASPHVLFLCPDIPADITNRKIAHNGITAIFGGNTTPFKGVWNIPPEVKELPEVPFADISDVVSGEGTQQEQETPSPQEKPPTVRRIEYPRCFYDPARIGGAEAFAYDDAQKRPCDQSGRSQAPAAGLMPFDKINLAKIDNENMFLRVSLGGNINNRDGTQTNIPKPIPIVILDYDHILNPETGDYAEGIPDELRDEIESLKQSTYCEFSQSRSGIHAYCIDNLPEPVTKPDGKPFLKIKADSKPEIFRGDSQVLCTGWRMPDACDDIQEIAISAIYTRQLGKSSVGNAVARAAALPAGPVIVANPPQDPDIDTARKYAPLIQSWERREEDVVSFLMRKDKIPYEASEAFQSITTRIAFDASQEAANWNIPYDIIATPDRIRRLWEQSDTYREEYATGEHEYNSSKIELTVTKAISAGRAKYEELMKRRAPAAAKEEEKGTAAIQPLARLGKIIPEYEANQACMRMAGKLPDIFQAGEGIYVVIDPRDGITRLVSTGSDEPFQRWCNHVFQGIGYDPKFVVEVFRNISILHTADPIPEIDISKSITAIPCTDGYISLKDGKRCERPAEGEFCPFVLNLTAADAEYDPDYRPRGRVLGDLLTYVGEASVEYMLSFIAACIPRIPANRKVVVLTGPSRSSKTTFGMVLGELGLAPPYNVDFSTEIDGKGRYRPELTRHISQYPVIFVNDPHDPDGTQVKKLCDIAQQYEMKYQNQRSVYQRATCVLTMNHPPNFKTSAMENKVFFICSHHSYAGEELPTDEYMDSIRGDGSLKDFWQEVLHSGLKNRWQIKIPPECAEHDRLMHTGASPLQKWLSACRKPKNEVFGFRTMAEIYLNYVVAVNPDTPIDWIEKALAKYANAGTWTPKAHNGFEAKSKNEIKKNLIALGFKTSRYNNQRGFYIVLPTLNNGTFDPSPVTPRIISTGDAWERLHKPRKKSTGENTLV